MKKQSLYKLLFSKINITGHSLHLSLYNLLKISKKKLDIIKKLLIYYKFYRKIEKIKFKEYL